MWSPASGYWGSSAAPNVDEKKATAVGIVIWVAVASAIGYVGSGLAVRPTPAKYPTMIEPAHHH